MTGAIRIASRGSPLALAQANLVRLALADAQGWDPEELDEICPIRVFRTSGDRIQDRPLAEAGGKGLFVKEIEDALLQDQADIAVHSMKDVPAEQPDGLTIAAVLPREEPYDVFIARDGAPFDKLAENGRLGTSSVRRQAQALHLRPDLRIVPLRGNVETRLLKLGRGEADAIILAQAGLIRLGLSLPDADLLAGDEWLPALCQGIVGIETREDDAAIREIMAEIDDAETHLAASCERGFLAALDGSCRTPIAGLASVEAGTVRFRGQVLTVDGRNSWTVTRAFAYAELSQETARAQSYAAGESAANEIRRLAGRNFPRF